MYQGARSVYCRYKDTKGVELVYDLTEKPLLFLDPGLVYPGIIIWEDGSGAAHPLSTDFYTNAHSLYPGHDDIHLFFVSTYYRGIDDCSDIRLALSLDGDLFEFVPGDPVIRREERDWDPDADPGATWLYPTSGLLPFGDGQMGILYAGSNVPHKWPRTAQIRHMARWALWDRDRLVALKAPDHGEFVTAGLILTKPTLFINAKTEMAGRIACELLDAGGQPVPGYGMEDADPIAGDHPKSALTWRGEHNLADRVGKKIYLRVRLTKARLFSLSAG